MIGDEETQKDLEDFLSSVKNKKKQKNDALKAASAAAILINEAFNKDEVDGEEIDTKSKPVVEMIKPRQRPPSKVVE